LIPNCKIHGPDESVSNKTICVECNDEFIQDSTLKYCLPLKSQIENCRYYNV